MTNLRIKEFIKTMTRDDEIVNRSIDYGQKTPSEYDDGRYDLSDLEWAFEEGAKWADKTMIVKVCEWLKDMACIYAYWEYNGDTYEKEVVYDTEQLIKDFKKAMEE